VLLLVPLKKAWAERLHMISRYASYYYAYEVMCVAVPIIAMTVKPMTSAVGIDDWGLCKALVSLYPDIPGMETSSTKCFAVIVNPLLGYYACAVNVAMFLISGFDGSFTHKYIHSKLHPEDPRPPPDLVECCSCCRCAPRARRPRDLA